MRHIRAAQGFVKRGLEPLTSSNDVPSTFVGVQTAYTAAMRQRTQRFLDERHRQLKNRPKIEKIHVFAEHRSGLEGERVELSMNRFLSTPHDCAKHISSAVASQAVLAVDDHTDPENPQWFAMHQPLTQNGNLRFLYYTDKDTKIVNQSFWQSCSFFLSMVLPSVFKSDFNVQLLPLPATHPTDGSFACDAMIGGVDDWVPTKQELTIMSRVLLAQLMSAQSTFDFMRVSHEKAAHILQPSRTDSALLDRIPTVDAESALALSADNDWFADKPVVMYRVGECVGLAPSHIPLINSTQQIGRFALTAVHPFDTPSGRVLRFQGCALPNALHVNSYTWDLLCHHSEKRNMKPVRLINETSELDDDEQRAEQ